jgi:hypothetical protein
MNARGALRAAFVVGYRHSWRLVLLNCSVGSVVVAAAAGARYALPAAVLALAAGPLVATLVYCAVVAARTGELDWADARLGFRLYRRRGLALGAFDTAGIVLGVLAIRFYSQHGIWLLAALAAYLLAAFCVWQLLAWPLAIANPDSSLRDVLAEGARALVRRPMSALGIGAALLVVNVAGTFAVIPVLTLTLAYSFLAAAHFVLPPQEA